MVQQKQFKTRTIQCSENQIECVILDQTWSNMIKHDQTSSIFTSPNVTTSIVTYIYIYIYNTIWHMSQVASEVACFNAPTSLPPSPHMRTWLAPRNDDEKRSATCSASKVLTGHPRNIPATTSTYINYHFVFKLSGSYRCFLGHPGSRFSHNWNDEPLLLLQLFNDFGLEGIWDIWWTLVAPSFLPIWWTYDKGTMDYREQ